MNFSEQIKQLRADRKLTQQQMADALNVSRQAVSNWGNDKNLPDIEMIIIMAQTFNLTLDELILGGKNMNNMTEKLINDGSENRRKEMNIKGIKIGSGLLGLGLLSLVIGLLGPVTMENYFGIAFSALMFCGVLTFLIVGLKDIFNVVLRKNGDGKSTKVGAAGGGLVVIGCIIYALGYIINTSVDLGFYGLIAIIAGIAVMLFSVIFKK